MNVTVREVDHSRAIWKMGGLAYFRLEALGKRKTAPLSA